MKSELATVRCVTEKLLDHTTLSITPKRLRDENKQYAGTNGVSNANLALGFKPAFRDTRTGVTYLSCFPGGKLAPFHLIDGLPDELVASRSNSGQATAIRPEVITGFLRDGCFYTRKQAAEAMRMSDVAGALCTAFAHV